MVRRQTAVLIAVASITLVVLWTLMPHVPMPRTASTFRLAAYPTSFAFFLAYGTLVVALTPLLEHRGRWFAGGVALSLVGVIITNSLGLPVVSDITKLAFAILAGFGFAVLIERSWWLLPIALLVPVADAWSVFNSRGVTNAIVERAERNEAWIDWPTVAVPIAGFPYADAARVGIVDFLFAALFLGVAARFELGLWRGVVGISAAFALTNLVAFESTLGAIPALPLLCLVMLVVYGRSYVRDLREEWRSRSANSE
jgi:hypothetical protein